MRRFFAALLAAALLCLSACGGKTAQAGEPEVPPDDISPSLCFTASDGRQLYLGMSADEAEALLGLTLEEGWTVLLPDWQISVGVQNGAVSSLGVSSANGLWSSGSGVTTDMDTARVTELLGEPSETDDSMMNTDRYIYHIGDASLTVTWSYDTDIVRVAAFLTDWEAAGSCYSLSFGSGDANVSYGRSADAESGGNKFAAEASGAISSVGILGFSHRGEGAFSVAQGGQTLFQGEGEYSGRIPAALLEGLSFDVQAGGDWDLRVYLFAPMFSAGRGFSGSGDGATQYIQLEEGISSVSYAYSGSGAFSLSLLGFSENELLELVSGEGPGEGSVPLTEPPDKCCFVISCSGEWAIELK